MKAAIRSALADSDIRAALQFYVQENVVLAGRFLDDLEKAIAHIEAHPASGSSRYSHELNIPQLKTWSLKRFPYVIFYIEHVDHLDVIRFVHERRDIPASLQDQT